MNDLRFAARQLRKLVVAALVILGPPIHGGQKPIGTFPLKRDGHLMLIEVRINDAKPVWFVVDSGAPHTVFDPSYARELGL
jgi:predicted aspartyl protease